MDLSIVIPTYSRNAILAKNVKRLISQITPQVEIIILDNASPKPVAPDLKESLGEDFARLEVVRNRVNVGGNENITRAIEYGRGRFIWVLGDDDPVLPDAVQRVLAAIENHPDAAYLNFSTPAPGHAPRNGTTRCVGPAQFLDAIDSFGQIIFISDCVYRADKIRPHLRMAKFYQNTCAPLFAGFLSGMHEDDVCVLLNVQIVNNGAEDTPQETQMSVIPIALGFSKLMELPLRPDLLRRLVRVICQPQSEWITFAGVLHQLLLDARFNNNAYGARIAYSRIEKNFFGLDSGFRMLIRRYVGWAFLAFPFAGYSLFNALYKWRKGESTGLEKMKDRKHL